ncbi:MAG: HAMP domain-containing sensor histidine kinase [Acidobacteriota bacterium]
MGSAVAVLLTGLFFTGARESLSAYLLIGFAVTLCAGVTAWSIGNNVVRRIRQLELAAEQFADRTFEVRVPADGSDEIARLGKSFNSMAHELAKRAERFDEIDRVKSEFVSSVSHELRTPLTTIKALTRLLMRSELTEAKRREYLETISVECDRQIDLVLNLLDLSRIEGGVFRIGTEPVDVPSVIESCIKAEAASAEKRRHSLRVEPLPELRSVCGDSKALRRVLSNLIENAIKYTPDGGSIRLSADNEGEFVAISVTDNGRGIPAEDLPILFDKFHRGRPSPGTAATGVDATDEEFLDDAEVSGVGLGLYLARNVITQMGGTIDVDTKVGRGSTFTLHLPIWDGEYCREKLRSKGDR